MTFTPTTRRLQHSDEDHHDQRHSGHADGHLVQPADITYGTALTARSSTRRPPCRGRLSTAGRRHVLNAGAGQTLSVTFTPTTRPTTPPRRRPSRSMSLKATPTITWANPADIAYGTALGSTQLDATANYPGTFIYAPPGGHGSARADQRDPVGDVHSDRPADYNPVDGDRHDQCHSGDAHHHLGRPRRHHLRHGAGAARSSTRRRRCPGPSPTRRPLGTILNAGTGRRSRSPSPRPTRPITRRQRRRPRSTCSRPRRLTGPTRRTSPTARRSGATQLDATASVPGTFTYTPAAGTVLNAGKGQTLSVTFTPTDTTDYTTATATVDDQRHASDAHVTWANPATSSMGRPGRVAARRDGDRAGDVRLLAGRGHGPERGKGQTLSVTFTPTDTTDYTTVPPPRRSTSPRRRPTITWPTPADISMGRRWASTSSTRRPTCPGTFAYTPPSGTVLNAGDGPDPDGRRSHRPTTTDYNTVTRPRHDQRRARPRRRSPGPSPRNRLRDALGEHAARRDGERAGDIRLLAGARARS